MNMSWSRLGDESMKYQPMVIICDTVKGKGVKEFENNNDWHYLHIDKETYASAVYQLT